MPGDIPPLYGDNPDTQDAMSNEVVSVLRSKNIKEYHSVLTTAAALCFPNGVAIESGIVVTFKNKGIFDGNWIVQKVTLNTSGGKLTTDIEFRKCIIPPITGQASTAQPN
jgi:hypothetical protein